MNQKRINKVLEKMEERGIDYLLVTDPVSIDYLLDYVNHPGERMYVMVLSSKGNHQLFFNNLFYVGEDLGMPITWFDDTDNGPALLADYLKDAKVIGVDKNMPARFLIPVQNSVNAKYVLGSQCVDEVRMQKDDEEKALMFKASEMNDTAMAEVKRLLTAVTRFYNMFLKLKWMKHYLLITSHWVHQVIHLVQSWVMVPMELTLIIHAMIAV